MSELFDELVDMGTPKNHGHDLLADLSARMKLYDQRHTERQALLAEKAAHKEALSGIDITRRRPGGFTEELGRSALELYVINKELELVDESINQTKNQSYLRDVAPLIGKRATLISLDPEYYTIGTSRRNKYGQLDGLSKWYSKRTGTIEKIQLEPVYGGAIQFSGSFGRVYSASPLVDRDAGYNPAFALQLR